MANLECSLFAKGKKAIRLIKLKQGKVPFYEKDIDEILQMVIKRDHLLWL